MLKVKFTGAIKGVTGSCTWLWHTDSDTQLLVDCGMHQGSHEIEWNNQQTFEFDASQIKYVLLTHAHIDHCGLLPKLITEGFNGWVYCTEATRDIAIEMLTDAARLSDLYSLSDVEKIKWHPIDSGHYLWKKPLRLEQDLCVTFLRGSHVLGACAISISWAKNYGDRPYQFLGIHFTGDVGCQTESNPYLPLMKDDHYPFPSTNYIVTESTYGSRVRYVQSSEDRITTLARVLNKTLNQENGKVLIPTFAFHRMQELIADLCVLNSSIQRDDVNWDNKDRDITVLCHSGLSNRLNAIYARSLSKKLANGKYQYLNNVLPERLGIAAGNVATIFKRLAEQGRSKFGNITFVTPSDGDKTTLIENADIILATSGMCESGAASDYFEMLKDSPANSVVITGFQSSGSVGRRLVDGDLEALSCRLDVHDMSAFYSAHGDQTKLLENIFYLGQFKSNSRCATVFINHGDAESKNVLRSKIMQISQDQLANYREVGNVLLASNRWFDLNHGEYLAESTNKMIDLYALSTNELLQEIERRKFALT